MNEVDYRTETQRHEVDVPDEDGNVATETVSETVLVIELTHRSPEEMRDEYGFNARQNEYLTLLLAEDTTALWGDLLGGFAMGELGGRGSRARLRHHAGRTARCNGRCRWRARSPRRRATAPTLSPAKSATTAAPTSRYPRAPRSWRRPTAP